MKIFVVLPVSIVLMSILICPMARAAPPIPEEYQIVAPDPSLPKELSAFLGKYEGYNWPFKYFVIVAKIDKEKAILYMWRETSGGPQYPGPIYGALYEGWETIDAQVFKERGQYQLWYRSRYMVTDSNSEARLDGKYLKLTSVNGVIRLTRVP